MNIFVLDKDPSRIPSHYCDVHLRKMIVETAQLLCNAHDVDAPYKRTHYNHPCSVWARTNVTNYLWLVSLGLWICAEYHTRTGKIHKTYDVLSWLEQNIPGLPSGTLTPWPQCMPKEFQASWGFGSEGGSPFDMTVKAYRRYYASKLRDFRQRGLV
jgi:hypothetical protein